MSNTVYFGYGTFLDDKELFYYLPNSQKITTARAVNHKLVFHAMKGRDTRGYCHLSDKLDALGETTHGILVKHDERYFIDYDGFERCFLTVYGDDGAPYDCWTLRMSEPGLAVCPPSYYWQHILTGLNTYNFSPEYTKKVIGVYNKCLPCKDNTSDPKINI